MALLHIYDAGDFTIALTASARGLTSLGTTYRVPIKGGLYALLLALDKVVDSGLHFSRCLFETHGGSGRISFGGEQIYGSTWRTYYRGRGYEKIFNTESRIYFNGCNVADDPFGWDFLDGAGSLFLVRGGGVTFAQTGSGHPILFTGHVVHFGQDTYYSVWGPGGDFKGHHKKEKPKSAEELFLGPGSLIGDTRSLVRWLSTR